MARLNRQQTQTDDTGRLNRQQTHTGDSKLIHEQKHADDTGSS